jgi:hypothetical protein
MISRSDAETIAQINYGRFINQQVNTSEEMEGFFTSIMPTSTGGAQLQFVSQTRQRQPFKGSSSRMEG